MKKLLATAAMIMALGCASTRGPVDQPAACARVPGKEGPESRFYPSSVLWSCFPDDELHIRLARNPNVLSLIPEKEPYLLMDLMLMRLPPETLAVLIAHEVGHYRLHHKVLQADEPRYMEQELEADDFSARAFPLGACKAADAFVSVNDLYGIEEDLPEITMRRERLERICAEQQAKTIASPDATP